MGMPKRRCCGQVGTGPAVPARRLRGAAPPQGRRGHPQRVPLIGRAELRSTSPPGYFSVWTFAYVAPARIHRQARRTHPGRSSRLGRSRRRADRPSDRRGCAGHSLGAPTGPLPRFVQVGAILYCAGVGRGWGEADKRIREESYLLLGVVNSVLSGGVRGRGGLLFSPPVCPSWQPPPPPSTHGGRGKPAPDPRTPGANLTASVHRYLLPIVHRIQECTRSSTGPTRGDATWIACAGPLVAQPERREGA